MNGFRRLGLAASLAAFGAFLLAPPSHGTVAVGSNLDRAPQLGAVLCGGAGCTYGLYALDSPAFAAPGGVISPVNGTVTGWRIRTGGSSVPTSLRVVRPLAVGLFTGGGTSSVVTPPTGTVSPTFGTQLPIQIGDLLGIQCCAGGTPAFYFRVGDGDSHQWFAPGLIDGGPGKAPDDPEGEVLVQADIEPTSAITLAGKPKRRNGGKLKIRVAVPNAGTLVAGDAKDKGIGATAAAPRRFKRTTRTVDGPGVVTFKVKPNKATKRKLRTKDRLKVKVKIAFTPIFGDTPNIQRVKAKIEL